MRYSVFLEPVSDPGFEGYYYAHIPTLDLTTHGLGPEGALAAAKELVEVWIAEKRGPGKAGHGGFSDTTFESGSHLS